MKQPRKKQLNVRVPKTQHENITGDLKLFPKKSKDIIVEAALMNLFLLKPDERELLYNRFPDKIFGRPLKKQNK
jgi:hypothetical protein